MNKKENDLICTNLNRLELQVNLNESKLQNHRYKNS